MRRAAELQAKLLEEARLADAGFADHKRELALASHRPLPAPTQEVELLLAPDERGEGAGTEAPAAARADDPKELDRLGDALEVARALPLDDEEPGHVALNVHGDEHGTRLGNALDARGDIRRIAEHFSRLLDHDRPRLEPDPRQQFRRALDGVPRVDLTKGALDGERRPHRALRVVLLRRRVAEESHQPVAEPLQHMPAQSGHCT